VENLSNNLEKTRLVSPIEGPLIETYANMGEIVTAGKPVAQIKDLDSIEIVALVDEDDLGGIKEGQAVEITINAYPDKTFEGKVRLVSNKSMEEMGVVYFKVYISFKETPDLLAGLSGDVRIVTDKIEDTIVIPNDAVKERGEKDFVYIKKDGEIIEKEIKINARNNNFSSVSEGLNEGDKLLFPEDLEE
ncbi:MAG: efflux RND transporter periplasmic adaptor subunit, partial [Candidatus Humimicrobiaceae bacterium]